MTPAGARGHDPRPRHPHAILTDIEGTTTPISFVRDVLFPYARGRLADFLATHAAMPEVVAHLAEVARLAPRDPPIPTLLAWMDADAKVTPLKALQGMIWHDGYLAGDLKGELYPDVAPALRRWNAEGIRLGVYSSGSVTAQRLLFGHTDAGDLCPLFHDFHDTRIGDKRAAASYRAITALTAIPAGDWLFLSDLAAELDAARDAGLSTCQLVRPDDDAVAAPGHPQAENLNDVERLWQAG